MDIKWKNNKKKEKAKSTQKTKKIWLGYLVVGLLILVTAVTTYKIGTSLREIQQNTEKEWQEKQKQNQTDKINLEYCNDNEKMAILANIHYLNYKIENMYKGVSASQYLLQSSKTYKKLENEEEKDRYDEKATELMNLLYSCYRMDYSVGNNRTHTYIYDTKRGVSAGEAKLAGVLNGKNLEELKETYKSYMVLEYDTEGKGTIKTSYNMEVGSFQNYIDNMKLQAVADYYNGQGIEIYEIQPGTLNASVYEEETYEEMNEDGYRYEQEVEVEVSSYEETGEIKIDFPEIKNTQIVIGFTPSEDEEVGYYATRNNDVYELSFTIVATICIILFFLSIILQNIKYLGLKEQYIFNMPTELVCLVGFFGLCLTLRLELPYQLLVEAPKDLSEWISQTNGGYAPQGMLGKMPQIICVLGWICFYGVFYWGGANVLPYLLHPFKNIRKKSFVIAIIRWIVKQVKKLWNYIGSIETEKGLKYNVLKIVIANLVVASFFCCGWFLGIIGVIVYSVILYVLLMMKGAELERQYQSLLQLTKNMAEGELNQEITEDLGVFEPLKAELSTIRKGFKQAVEKEVRSQNMKTELITNVSHDLKTPLTAIITYIDLLKEENLSEETREEYIATLDKKSQRLKVLIEDLFEVSKATTNNITMHFADVDIVNLIKQVRLENEERIMNSDLHFRWNLPEEKCVLRLDPQKTYRIIENLLVNALKYSMSGSRIYVDLEQVENEVVITMKNISATELNFDPEEITERFVRGDLSRNTEGSGLGLAIVRSFTELQNGTFYIEIDGDLFKATVKFYR